MCLIACTLCPPHSVPACSSSFFAVCNDCWARSTSAGLSFCGLENRVADGDIIITENSSKVAIFIVNSRPAIQSVLTKVKRRSHPARSTEPSMAGFRCVLKCFYSENISRIQNPPYCTWTKYRCTVAPAYSEGKRQPATNAPAKRVQTFVRCERERIDLHAENHFYIRDPIAVRSYRSKPERLVLSSKHTFLR